MNSFVTANGNQIEAQLPCTLEEFLVAQKLLPRSVVLERAPSSRTIPRFATVYFGVKVRPCWIGINVLPWSAYRAR